jgi:hypothetical protein
VSRVILHTKLLGNHFGYAGTGPKVGTVTGLARSAQENLHQSLLLFLVQAGFGAEMWFGLQGLQPSFLYGLTPAPYRGFGSSDDFGNLADFPAFQQ